MRAQQDQHHSWTIYGLILLGITARLVPHPPNVTPVMAIALFAGTYLSKRSALLLPLAILAVSDLLIGWHQTVPFTWSAFVLTGALGWWVRRHPGASRILLGAAGGSLLFFLVTNFGVWATQDLYPRTISGLWQCYVAAIPFFRNSLIGDLIYTAALFAGYQAAVAGRLAVTTATSK